MALALQAESTLMTNVQFYNPRLQSMLTCWSEHTVAEFTEAWHAKVGSNLWHEGTTMADAVCILSLVLHEFLERQGLPLDLFVPAYRMAQIYLDQMYAVLQNIHFEGLSASFKYPQGSGDPNGTLDLSQVLR